MSNRRWAEYDFLCDECDGEIGRNEEYIEFQGMNYCEECFDGHKHDLDIDEEGTEITCACCGAVLTEGYYYRFEDETFCVDCVDDNKRWATRSSRDYDTRMDSGYEARIACDYTKE